MHLRYSPNVCSLGFATMLACGLLSGVEALLAQRRSPPVLVRRIIDGDSIEVAAIGRVNLLGIAAPRSGGRSQSSPLAREARQRLEGLLANRWVRLEYENDTAPAGRAAYVFLDDGRFVNAWMLREGLARAVATSALRRSRELLQAEADARLSRRGIWAAAR
jgi:endonuclease YncB( thermonuclease family)